MKIALTGASGFIGRNIVKRLLQDKHHLTLLTHRAQTANSDNRQIKTVSGGIDDIQALKKAFEGADIIIHLVGIIVETRKNSFEKTVIEGTKNVVAAAKQVGNPKIIYISALGTSANATTKYHQSKYEAEQAIINSGLEYIIFRPSLVYGEGDGFVSMLSGQIKQLPFTPVIGHGRYLFQPIYIDDLAEAVNASLTKENCIGKIIDLAGDERLEYLQILTHIKQALGKKRMNFHIPLPVMKIIARLLEMFLKPAPVTVDQMTMLEMGNVGDNRFMKKELNIEPVKFFEGLEKYLR